MVVRVSMWSARFWKKADLQHSWMTLEGLRIHWGSNCRQCGSKSTRRSLKIWLNKFSIKLELDKELLKMLLKAASKVESAPGEGAGGWKS